jgi:hypothetical protein
MSRLDLALLGAPRVQHGGQPITFATRKTLALLVYLAAEETVQRREKLAGLLWPGSDAQRARTALRRTLAYLRDGLGLADTHLRIGADALSVDGSADLMLDLHTVQRAWSLARQLGAARGGEAVDEQGLAMCCTPVLPACAGRSSTASRCPTRQTSICGPARSASYGTNAWRWSSTN